MTADARSTYLRQLMGRLLYSGVDGSDVGELVAEVSQHLEDTGEDPMVEFGSVSDFAGEVIEQRRVNRRTWLQRVGLPWLSVVPFAVALAALFSQKVDGSHFVALAEGLSGLAAVVAVVVGVTVIVRRQRGDRKRPYLLGMGVAAVVSAVGSLLAGLIDPDVGWTLTTTQRWSAIAVGFALAGVTLWFARNPVKFPPTFDGGPLTRSPFLNLTRR